MTVLWEELAGKVSLRRGLSLEDKQVWSQHSGGKVLTAWAEVWNPRGADPFGELHEGHCGCSLKVEGSMVCDTAGERAGPARQLRGYGL